MTTRIIANQKHRAALWARENFPGHGLGEWGDNFTALLLEKDLEIRAAVFYTGWQPGNSCDLHVAAVFGERWLNRPFLTAAFRYPFLELGVRRVGALVASNNLRSLRFVRHLGFVHEGTAREAWAEGVDIECFGMKRAECRWLAFPKPDIWRVDDRQALSPETARSGSDGQRAV